MSNKNLMARTNVFGPRLKPTRGARRDRRRRWEAGSAQVERLEERLALTLATGYAITSDSRMAWVIAMDNEESAYLSRGAFGEMRVDDNASFTSPAMSYQGFLDKRSSTGSFAVDTIYVTTGRWGSNFSIPSLTGSSVSFSAGDTNLIPGSVAGFASITAGGTAFGAITFFHRAANGPDLDIEYGPGYDRTNGPDVSGRIDLFTGQITLTFRKDDKPFPATVLGTVVQQYATYNANTTGAQRLEVREGFDFDQRLMVDLKPAGSSIVVGSPWKATKGAGNEGFYSGFNVPSIALLMGSQIEMGAESIDIRAPMSSTSAVGIGNAGIPSRVINVNAPLAAPQFVINPSGTATARGLLQVSKTGIIGPGGTLSVEATDADIIVENSLKITNQTYFLRSQNAAEQFQFVTTSPSTGFSTGLIEGDTVSITMAAQGLSNTSPSVLDLNTKIRSLRASAAFSTPVAEAFPVSFAVRDADDLLVEAVPNAAATMVLQSGGTLTVNAAIDTSSLLTLNGANSIVTNAPVSTTIGDIVMTTPVVSGQGRITAGSGYLKASVRAVSTTPLAATFTAGTPTTPATLTGNTGLTVTIDGVPLVNGDRVLVQGQTDAAQNGIYRVSSPATAVGAAVDTATTSPLTTPEVRLATSGPVNAGLSNYSYSNGVNGVGSTLTNVLLPSQAGTPDNQRHNLVLTVNGVTAFGAGDRILVKNQATAFENGIYYFASTADVPTATQQLADVDVAWDAADTPASWAAATTAAYGNGTAGVGATLTGTPVAPATGIALPAIEGQTLAKGDRILVKGFIGGAASKNGVYQVTEPGSATVPWVLTRVNDFDQSSQAEISNGQSVYVRSGTNNGGKGFVVLGLPGTVTVGTTQLNFSSANLWKLTRAIDADSLALLDQFTSVRVAASAADSFARAASNYNTRYFQANSLAGGSIGLSSLSYLSSYAYLSATALGAISVDGISLNVNDRVLVKNQAISEDNGAYTVKKVGTSTTPWILQRDPADQLITGTAYNVLKGTQATQNWYLSTGVPTGTQIGTTPVVVAQITTPATWQLQRTTDADTGSELPLGSTVNVTAGTTFANTGWTLATPGPVALDTTKLVFNQSRKQDVFVASTTPVDGTYELQGQPNNTITGNTSSLILTIDGIQFLPTANGGPTSSRVLIKDQANAAENGTYDVTTRSNVIRQLADVRAATTAALLATYRNNTPGVIASTLIGTGLLPLIDGVELVTGDRVLVQNQDSAAENGVYVVTRTGGESGDYLVNGGNRDWVLTRAADMDAAPEFTVGTGVFVRESVTTPGGFGRRLAMLSSSGVVVGTTTVAFGSVTAWQLTRSTDADTAGALPYGFYIKVTNGATNAQTGWALGTDDPITLGTTPLDFYASNAPFVKGNGNLAITSATGNLTVNSLVSATGDTVRLTASGATAAIGGTSRIAADRAELVAGGAISANGSVTTLVATSGAGITFDNSGALELEAVQTSAGNINVSAGGRITATAVRAGGSGTSPTTPTGGFNIDLVFGAGVPSAVQAAMRSAADRWQQIIVGDIAAFTDPVSGQLIDDIVVYVQAGLLGPAPSDGGGNTLANAAPTGFRPAGSANQFLPFTAQVGVDTADYTNSQLVSIMTHELGHALGFTSTAESLNLISSSYVWTGQNATREYRALMQPGAAGVPMETNTAQFGSGSLYVHWSEQVLGNELMTPAIGNAPNPLSRITVGAFEDMGYTVNYAAADVYPSSASVRPAAAAAGDGNISLTARAGNIDLVALTAEQDKVTLSAANGTITGLSPAAAWLDWTAKVAPQQSFYNDFQKLSANLTGAGSIVVNNPGAVTLQDVRTADGNIFVTAGGTLAPVSVVAGGKGTVYLDYSGVGGTIAAGTITSNAASPRVLRKDSVRVATTANIVLSGLQTVDGVALATNDRVLVRSQNDQKQNGVYVVAAGGWTRALDANDAADLPVGVRVAVTEGTQKGDYECVRGSTLTLGTTTLAFERVKILEIADIAPVEVATATPIATGALSSTTVVDGVTLTNGDRVLLRRQADPAENGIYSFDGTGLTRTSDTLIHGALVVVNSGTQAGGYMLTFAGAAATAGTTPLAFDPVAVAITSSTGITDGSVGVDAIDITAGTVRLVARDGSIGTVTNRLDLAADTLIASASASGLASLTTGANIYLGDTGDIRIANAFASGRMDVAAGGISGKLSADKVETNAAGVVTLTAPGDIIVGTIGSVDPSRRTALVTLDAATGFLRNSPDGTAVTSDKVRLVSRNFASFDVGKLDNVDIFSIKQTSAGVLQTTFNRSAPVTFDDVTTNGGNIAFVNNGTGDFLIGTGGINAGAFNGVSLSTSGQIGAPLVGNQGKIAGGGLVSLTADTTISALTSAGSLAAKITGTTAPGSIALTETDSAQIGAAGIDAGGVGSLITLAVGGQLDGLGATSGLVKGDAATVTARTGIGLKTELASLAASTASGVIVVRENDDLTVGAAGINAALGNVSISTGEASAATAGSLSYDRSSATSGLITGALVTLDAKKPGSIDVITKATEIAGSTVAGSFSVTEADGLAIGRAGVAAGRTVRVATTAALAATYANNTPGLLPATLTATANGALVIDGVTLAVGDRVLVKNQTSQPRENGIYVVTAAGSSTAAWRLTRAADGDTDAKVPSGTVVNVSEGSANGGTAYVISITGALGTAALSTAVTTTPGTDISITTVKGDILTPATYADGEGRLAGDSVMLTAAGAMTGRTDARLLTALAGTGGITIAEKSAVTLTQAWASATSGTGSVVVTAGGEVTAVDVRARGTRGSVTLSTTAGDIKTQSGATVAAPESITLDAARRISAKDANGTPLQAPAVNLTARGPDDLTTNPATPALDAEVITKSLSASAPNGSAKVVVESTDTLVLGAAPSPTAPRAALTAAGSVDISSLGGDVVVFGAPQARFGGSAVRAAATTNLSVAPSGATLTASANASINTSGIGGVTTLRVGDRVLLTGQATAAQNGIYVVTSLGSSGSKWTLTRAADSDSAAKYPAGSLTRVTEGTNAGKVYRLTTGSVGGSALTFVDQTTSLTTKIDTGNSAKAVSYVVSTTAGTNADGGTLGNMIDLAQSNAATPANAAIVFSSTLTAPIFLTQELPLITKPLVIDGSQRLAPTTLARSTSPSLVAVNGSGITTARSGSPLATNAAVDGFTIDPGTGNPGATIASLALGGFGKGAAVKIASGTGSVVRNSTFGLTTTNTKLANQTGVTVAGGLNATISGNTVGWSSAAGLQVTGGTGTTLRGNFIGTNAAGSLKVGNTGSGISLTGGTGTVVAGNTISNTTGSGMTVSGGSTVATIGSTTAADRNLISGNSRFGVEVLNNAFASIVGNSISANTLGGISSPAANPSGTLDAPVITNTTTSRPTLRTVGSTTSLTFAGTLTGSGQRHIDVYASPATSTGNQGQVYLGRISISSGTTFSGAVSFASSLGVTAGWRITATVTATGTNPVTSAFSTAVAAVAGTTGTGTGGTGTGGTGTGGTGTGTGGGSGVVSNPRPPVRP